MKKNKIKNRKVEHRNTFFFRFSLIFSLVLIISSLLISYKLFIQKKSIVTPLPKVLSASQSPAAPGVDPKQTIQQALYEAKQPYDTIKEIDPVTYEITIDGDEEVLVTSQKDIHEQISSLQAITSQLTMEGKRFSRLDVRYDKPVIVF